MKLYEVPRNSYIKLLNSEGLPFSDQVYLFSHVDGMYSYCIAVSKVVGVYVSDDKVVRHFAAWSDVEVVW